VIWPYRATRINIKQQRPSLVEVDFEFYLAVLKFMITDGGVEGHAIFPNDKMRLDWFTATRLRGVRVATESVLI
jgi:hypothetical protein